MKKSLIISIVIVIISTILAIWFIMNTEGNIPIHWNAAGEIDGYGPPSAIFIFPGVSLFMTLLLYFLPKIDPKGDNIKKSGPFLPILTVLLSILMLGIQIITILAANYSDIISINIFLSLLLAILFGIMGFYLPGVKPNYMVGLRTPWTLHSEEVWIKTHKASGKWFILTGVLFLIGMFIKDPYNIIIPIVCMAIIMIGIVIYSYILFTKEHRQKE